MATLYPALLGLLLVLAAACVSVALGAIRTLRRTGQPIEWWSAVRRGRKDRTGHHALSATSTTARILLAVCLLAAGAAFVLLRSWTPYQAIEHGQPGTFTPQAQHCTSGKGARCTWNGTFVGAGGVRFDAHLDSDLGAGRGTPPPSPVAVVRPVGQFHDGTWVYLDRAWSWGASAVGGGAMLAIATGLAVHGTRTARRLADQPPSTTMPVKRYYFPPRDAP